MSPSQREKDCLRRIIRRSVAFSTEFCIRFRGLKHCFLQAEDSHSQWLIANFIVISPLEISVRVVWGNQVVRNPPRRSFFVILRS